MLRQQFAEESLTGSPVRPAHVRNLPQRQQQLMGALDEPLVAVRDQPRHAQDVRLCGGTHEAALLEVGVQHQRHRRHDGQQHEQETADAEARAERWDHEDDLPAGFAVMGCFPVEGLTRIRAPRGTCGPR